MKSLVAGFDTEMLLTAKSQPAGDDSAQIQEACRAYTANATHGGRSGADGLVAMPRKASYVTGLCLIANGGLAAWVRQ